MAIQFFSMEHQTVEILNFRMEQTAIRFTSAARYALIDILVTANPKREL